MKRAGTLVSLLLSAIVPILAGAVGAMALGACASCQSTVRVAAMPVIAAGFFDGAVADPNSHLLYLADHTDQGVDVVDISTSTPRFVSTVNLGSMPNGLAMAPDQDRLYAGLENGSVAVIDQNSMKVVDTIPLGIQPVDLMDYSQRTHRLYAGNGGGGEVVTIDATTDQVGMRMAAKAPVEQPRYDPADGMVYVSIKMSSKVLRIDPATGSITRTYSFPKCEPSGMAINPSRQLAVLACGSSVGLLNLNTGAQSVTRAVQGGDIVSYDSAADRFVIASPHARSDSAVGVFSGSGEFIGSVPSAPKAHAAVFDAAHGLVYAPSGTGMMSFAPGACAAPPDWLQFAGGMSLFAVPFFGLLLILFLYSRRMGKPRGRGPSRPTYRDLQKEDLEAERERMRALEDGMFGSEP